MEESTSVQVTKKSGVTWTKANIAVIISIVMGAIGIFQFVKSYNKDLDERRNKDKADAIYQHDLEQRIDSIQTAFSVMWHDYEDNKSQQVNRTKTRDAEKRENDVVHYEFGYRLTKLEQWKEDFVFYKLKK